MKNEASEIEYDSRDVERVFGLTGLPDMAITKYKIAIFQCSYIGSFSADMIWKTEMKN